MSCEPGPQPIAGRSLSGWLILLLLPVLAAFYLHVFSVIARPQVDEAYRRTYLTGEFAVYPAADGWKPGDGLDYRPGTLIDLRQSEQRNWLARFDWHRVDTPTVTLRGFAGRLFLHLPETDDAATRRHRLRLGFVCKLSAQHGGRLSALVNGTYVGDVYCGMGAVQIDAIVPAGVLGQRRYDEITIHRLDGGLLERLETRLGLRVHGVELAWFQIDPI